MASMMMMIIILIMHNLNRWSPVSLNTVLRGVGRNVGDFDTATC